MHLTLKNKWFAAVTMRHGSLRLEAMAERLKHSQNVYATPEIINAIPMQV